MTQLLAAPVLDEPLEEVPELLGVAGVAGVVAVSLFAVSVFAGVAGEGLPSLDELSLELSPAFLLPLLL
jgi:hypothetical protein